MDLTSYVRDSTARVMKSASHVTINKEKIPEFAARLHKLAKTSKSVEWDAGDLHYFKDAATDGPLTCQYIFVLDALNFCFWPVPGMEYEHLAKGLKKALEEDPHALDATALCTIEQSTIADWFSPYVPCQLEERQRKLHELGNVLRNDYDGLAYNVVLAAQNSAIKLVSLLTSSITGFQDHVVYNGSLVYLYKRAQILVGDIWAAYGRRLVGFGSFSDIDSLTTFADYRVPQLLRPQGILCYSADLASKVDSKKSLPAGCEEEVEIRAATVQAVELIHQQLVTDFNSDLKVVEIDWLLWQIGEEQKDELLPHHRTLSVYY